MPGLTASGFQVFQLAASLQESKLFAERRLPSSRAVAREGYYALMSGKNVAVNGASNRLLVLTARLMPRRALVSVVRAAQEGRR